MAIPEGWTHGTLGKECAIEIGGTPSRGVDGYWDTDRSTTNAWVSIKDMQSRVITNTAEMISKLGIRHSNVKLQPKGTVLLSFKLSIGRVAFAGVPLYTNEAIAGLRPRSLDREYLYHGLQQWDLLQDVDQAIKGATLNKEKLKKIKFTYPKSRAEQSKIAEVLSTVDQAIAQTEALIAKQQRIKTGLMQDLLTCGIDEHGNLRSEATHTFKDSPLGRIPAEWEVKRLGEVVNLQVGYAFKSSWFSDEGIRLIRGENVGAGKTDWTDTQRLPTRIADGYHEYLLDVGDLIIGMDRTFTKQGFKVTCLLESDIPSLLVQRVGRFVPYTVSREFMRLWIQSFQYRRALLLQQKGMDIPHLSKDEILSPLIALPNTTAEMNVVGERYRAMERIVNDNKRELKKYHSLKTGLMQDLLTGKVRVTPLLEQVEAMA
jgi:type I restriction enzyme S subunit